MEEVFGWNGVGLLGKCELDVGFDNLGVVCVCGV